MVKKRPLIYYLLQEIIIVFAEYILETIIKLVPFIHNSNTTLQLNKFLRIKNYICQSIS